MNSCRYDIKTNDDRILYKLSLASRPNKTNEEYPEHHSNFGASIVYIAGGEGTVNISDNEYRVAKGDLVLIRSMEPHHIFSLAGSELAVADLSFSPIPIMPPNSEWMDKRLSKLFFSMDKEFQNILPPDNPLTAEIAEEIKGICNEASKEKPNDYLLKAKFLAILSRLPQIFDIDKLTDHGNASKYTLIIANSVAFINSNLTRDISVKKIANNANMETSRFSEIFKSIHGISPWNYVLNARIKLAKSYLRENECYYSITQIASMAGFENLSNFNKIFKSIVGMAPSEYRKKTFMNKNEPS